MSFTFKGAEYRTVDKGERKGVQRRVVGERRWQPVALAELAREHARDAGPWPWLLEHGVEWPSPSGYTPEAESRRNQNQVQVKLRLQKSVDAELERLAAEDGTTKSATVAGLVTKERARRDRP